MLVVRGDKICCCAAMSRKKNCQVGPARDRPAPMVERPYPQ